MSSSNTYWHKVKQAGAQAWEGHLERKRRFQETNDPAAWEGQMPGGEGLFMMSLDCEERAVTAGAVYAVPMRVVGQKIVDKSHRVANFDEIAEMWRQDNARQVKFQEIEDRLNQRRTVRVVPVSPRHPA